MSAIISLFPALRARGRFTLTAPQKGRSSGLHMTRHYGPKSMQASEMKFVFLAFVNVGYGIKRC